MTREEAIKIFKEWAQCNYQPTREAAKIAVAALTPPTQEQMERVWGADWLNFYGEYSEAECSKCGDLFEVSPDEQPRKEYFDAFKQFYKFCPSCGAAMTPEAMEIVRKRLPANKKSSKN